MTAQAKTCSCGRLYLPHLGERACHVQVERWSDRLMVDRAQPPAPHPGCSLLPAHLEGSCPTPEVCADLSACGAEGPADTLPPVSIKPALAKRLSEYHRETWIMKRDALIAQAVNEKGGSLREVGELVGLSHTQVAEIAKRARGDQ